MKKAQASVDYLTTYAWAFMIIVGVISAYGYFFGFDITENIPESCNFGTSFSCEAIASKSGTMYLRLTNILPDEIILEYAQFTFKDDSKQIVDYENNSINSGEDFIIKTYEYGWIGTSRSDVLDLEREKEKVDVVLYYKINETGALPKNVEGTVVSKTLDTKNNLDTIDADTFDLVDSDGTKISYTTYCDGTALQCSGTHDPEEGSVEVVA